VPPLCQLALSVVVAIAVFLGGAIIFEQMERGYANLIWDATHRRGPERRRGGCL